KNGPLAGFRVLDLGMVVAGSMVGTILAEFGADVIKVEPPAGDTTRRGGVTFLGYNKWKRGIVMDLRQPRALELFSELVRGADIVSDNYRPGVPERLGISYEQLCRIKPDIISASITAYGGVGPLGMEGGYDPVVQIGSGQSLAQGGPCPVNFTHPFHDVPTA